MRRRLVLLLGLLAAPAWGAETVVPAEPEALARAAAAAAPGDVLRLAPGTHRGPVTLDRPVTLEGGGAATVDAGGAGTALTVTGPDVTIRGLTIAGSGGDHQAFDSGVRLLAGADRARVEGARLLGNLIGVDIHGARDALVRGNVIEGRRDARMNDRGNGVYVWNAPGSTVRGNDIRWGRDGIFVNTSKGNTFSDNRFRDLRFAVHSMNADDGVVRGNLSQGNHLGFAIMFSKRVIIEDNVSDGDRDHGVMLNYANGGAVRRNLVRGTADRCLFIYNTHKNAIEGNRFEGCGIGVHFTAGSERNAISGNAFVGNRTQVKYAGTQWVDWSAEGRGNYWSDHAAYDLNGDGVADSPFRPNDAMDRILWTQPAARLLMGAPAVQLVRWSQAAFPALLPGGVLDRAPLMRPVEIAVPRWSLAP